MVISVDVKDIKTTVLIEIFTYVFLGVFPFYTLLKNLFKIFLKPFRGLESLIK